MPQAMTTNIGANSNEVMKITFTDQQHSASEIKYFKEHNESLQ